MNCYLTVFEQVTWPRQMAQECVRLGLNPILMDNGSTYGPLRAWLDDCPYPVIRMGYNSSCYGFWRTGRHREQMDEYIVSDSDLDLSGIPGDVVERLREALAQNVDVAKAGVSLEIDDIPEWYPFRSEVITWEQRYWTERRGNAWQAGVGATFALYDPRRHDLLDRDFYQAVRLDRPYTARHLPWYVDFNQLSDELRYYYEHCDNVAHWGSQIKRYLQEISR